MSDTKGNAEASTDPEISFCQGRNGMATLTSLKIWEGSGRGIAYIDGCGKRGHTLNGGFGLDTGAMDQLAVQWLASRNGIHPDNIKKSIKKLIEESVDAVVG